ncbi:hypothetical protein SERLA73DRAFT_95738 [Serpula lacrymans var. lacrymans S7.3]|uniref:Phosphatidylserine decarboxylase n=2 Tax=Serpula lacrymans var. lacrymans TaxID=341189 RepID=F8Q915_SERL3|nr:uncharacterized protein SERLADRAFT_476857 [Serpula lacrymans var. lacrymans S7.9]EGN95070.1 hypothetical protein SERLA73DRAFT_95738 [Serpula lacrymans var. lacrymans S7.3]EGO20560.1 hypothetical protein SERLADRAFT_476857 [Serpula lacrymans var. lacrymans S7.9]
MSSLHGSDINKPLEEVDSNSLPNTHNDAVAHALTSLVGHSAASEHGGDVTQGIHGHIHVLDHVKWLKGIVPEVQSLAAHYHVGNFVIKRETGEKFFESMPIYARIGMHLLFCGREQVKLLEGSKRVEDLLREQSVREGKIYDSPDSVKSIPSFIQTYKIQMDELLEPDIRKYRTFNEFFSRKLKPEVRPVQNADDPSAFCCAADSRLVVYQSVDLAKKFWIKGDEFTIPALLDLPAEDPVSIALDGASLAIFRLAPADYHRFHSPFDATIKEAPRDVKGQYYTVNPQAINEPKLDVLSVNKRSVLIVEHKASGKPIAFVAVGALLVGSVVWTISEPGASVCRGQELGYFAYGGSTVVAVFPQGLIDFDDDLVKNSDATLETLVKVGSSLGHAPSA